ncbi:MAG: hypothetical protein JWQ63_46, partial [Mucilaginibacter sp.]|nr:hypothetical protein [Mucilaginibacter sp.]
MLKIIYNSQIKRNPIILLLILLMVLFINQAYSQAEVEPWGNITGIRKQGQLFEFESSLKVKYTNSHIASTAKERQQPHYKRSGDEQIITSNIDSLFFKETVKDLSAGKIKVTLSLVAHADIDISGVYFCITLPAEAYADGRFRLFGTKNDSLKNFTSSINSNYLDINASGIEVNSRNRKLKVLFDAPGIVSIKRETSNGENNLQFSVALNKGGLHKGDTLQKVFTIMA